MPNREHFNVGEAEYRWTTQDYSTADGIPLIGALDDNGLYIVTGFGGWGLTTAGVAAAIIRDIITQDQVTDGYHGIFDPRRELSAVDSALISARTSSGTDRDNSGELEAVSAVCTHLGGIVLWDKSSSQWGCPCHGSKFLPDGSVVNGPAQAPLPDKKELLDE